MRRTILALAAALALLAGPALAADSDSDQALNMAWARSQEANGNLRNAILVLRHEAAAMQAQIGEQQGEIAVLRGKCGKACEPPAPAQPASDAKTPAPAAPAPQAKQPAPAKP